MITADNGNLFLAHADSNIFNFAFRLFRIAPGNNKTNPDMVRGMGLLKVTIIQALSGHAAHIRAYTKRRAVDLRADDGAEAERKRLDITIAALA